MATDVLKIVTHEDTETAKKPPMRAGEQEIVSEVEPANLVELLSDIDNIKREIHERMRRVEAVKQAKSLLMEDAARTEALNKKFAEIGKLMNSVNSGFLAAKNEYEDIEPNDGQSRGTGASGEGRSAKINTAVRILNESAPLPWPKLEEVEDPVLIAYKSLEPQHVVAESIPFLEPQPEPDALQPSPIVAARQSVELPVTSAFEVETVDRCPVVEVAATNEVLAVTQEFWKQAEEATVEARRLFDESRSRLDESVKKQEQVAADYQTTQEALNVRYQSANARLEEATQCWKQTDLASVEAKRLFEEAAVKLNRAITVEEKAAGDFHSAQISLTTAYESACKRLEEAERFWREADQTGLQVKQMLEQASSELAQLRSGEQTATADLLSARQELTTAYQFAAVAAQRRLDAAEFFKRSAKWAVFAAAFSWVAMVWAVWFALRTIAPVWVPCVASTLIVCLAITFGRLGTRED